MAPDDLIERKLHEARVARLATTDDAGSPHIVPVCFAYDGTHIFTAIDRKPKGDWTKLARIRNITAHSSVALLIDDYQENWSELWYVLVRGNARILDSATDPERLRAVQLLRTKYVQYRSDLLPEDAPIICVVPEQRTAWASLRE